MYSLADWLESQHQNYPQITAERLRDRLLFDRVAVLLKTDKGLDLAGCVGWDPDEVGPIGHHDASILNKLSANGVRLIGPPDRGELLNAGLRENQAQTILVAPLKHGNVAFGVLLVGHEEPDSEAPSQGNGSFDGVGSFARSVAPDLHAWLLLRHLREQLAAHRRAHEQTANSAGSESPASADSQPAESEAGGSESPSPADDQSADPVPLTPADSQPAESEAGGSESPTPADDQSADPGTLLGRYSARKFVHHRRRSGEFMSEVLLVGHGRSAADLVRQMRRDAHHGMRIVGACVPNGSQSAELAALGVPVLGSFEDVDKLVPGAGADAVAVLACPEMDGAALRGLSWNLARSGIDLLVAPALMDVTGPRIAIRPVCGLPLLHVDEPVLSGGRRIAKGCVDRVASAVGLLILLPWLVAIGLTVRLTARVPRSSGRHVPGFMAASSQCSNSGL